MVRITWMYAVKFRVVILFHGRSRILPWVLSGCEVYNVVVWRDVCGACA